MRGMRSVVYLSALVLVGPAATAGAQQVVFDFEPAAGYVPGALAGQDGWVLLHADGAADVLATDNGPARPGTQCVLLTNDDGNGYEILGRLELERAFADVVAAGGGYVTYQYDLRRIEVPDKFHIQQTGLQIPGAPVMNWADSWTTWDGSRTPAGDQATYDRYNWAGAGAWSWHTHTWTLVYSAHDGGRGELLTYQLDNEPALPLNRVYDHDVANFMRNNFDGAVNRLTLFLVPMWWGEHHASYVAVDNISITAAPFPSALPAAHAGGPYTQDPGSWAGLLLDGTASSDDGPIVNYRWTLGHGGPVLYDGSDPTPLVDLGTGTHALVLTVTDETGLRDTAETTAVIGPRPPILDAVGGPWGTVHGDIHGTNAASEVPVLISPTSKFVLLNSVFVRDGQPPSEPGSAAIFDRFGNLYFLQRLSNRLFSYSPDLTLRWVGHYADGAEVTLGNPWGAGPGNAAVIAGLRYVYAIGGGIGGSAPARPRVYAFERGSGVLAWEVELPGEDWWSVEHVVEGAPKMTLYADKLYIHGMLSGTGLDMVNVYQVDATSGTIDWWNEVWVELDWDWEYPEPGPGAFAFVPNPAGNGRHYLLLNNISDPTFPWDGYNDMAAIEIDPDPVTGGAVSAWLPGEGFGTDGPYLTRSSPLYSTVTDLVYTPSSQGGDSGSNYALYAWDPVSGLVRTYALPGGQETTQGEFLTFALDFDGRTIHAVGDGAMVRSYKDNGDGTWTLVTHSYAGDFGYGFATQGALLRDDAGHSILITGSRQDCCGGPANEQKIVALDLSQPGGSSLPVLAEFALPTGPGMFDHYNFGPTPGPDGTLYFMCHVWGSVMIWRVGVEPMVPGACCLPDGSCSPAYAYDCGAAAGTFMGEGVECGAVSCVGACCLPNDTCQLLSREWCAAAGGVTAGLGADCQDAVCTTAEACASAVPVGVPGLALGDTTTATLDPVAAQGCGQASSDGPDLYYKVVGTGHNVTATLCASPVVWDSQLAVYEGTSCGALTCIQHSDDECCPGGWGCHGTITWASAAGATYYLRVFGWDYQAGEYGPYALLLSDDRPPSCPGDLNCDGAVSFGDINPFVLRLSNPGAYAVAYPGCPDANGDCNANGVVGFDDINPFVSLMSSGQGPCD